MKKITTLLLFVVFASSAKAQYVTLADTSFRNFLISKYPACFNSTKQMDTTCSAIVNATKLYCSHESFSSIDGVQYFDGLKVLNCSYNWLTSLPKLPANLDSLYCNDNYIDSLKTLPNNLKKLICNYQYINMNLTIQQLPVSLKFLNCSDNSLDSLPSTLSSLDTLICNYCTLIKLPILSTTLKYLSCQGNPVLLPNSLPAGLKYLDCSVCSLNTLSNLPSTLKYINCSSNNLTSLPSLPSTLTSLYCRSNSLTSLPSLPSTLTSLYCSNNLLTSLPTLPNTLSSLDCGYNPITSLLSLPTSLSYLVISGCQNLPASLVNISSGVRTLYCNYCNYTNLPILPSTLLTLVCSNNPLSTLPSLPTSLSYLNIDNCPNLPSSLIVLPASLKTLSSQYNNYSNLPVLPNGLGGLYINGNSLVNITNLPNSITVLYCNNNLISSIQNLPSSLQYFTCVGNTISELPKLPKTLVSIACHNNPNLFCLPFLPSSLNAIYLDSSNIKCIPNKVSPLCDIYNGYTYVSLTIPICNPTNNVHQCVSFPTITGKIFHDINLNNVKDVDEAPKAYGLVMLSNGDYTFTDTTGVYSFQTDTLGTFYITTLTPSFYHPVPSIQYVTANKYDTIIKAKDIAFQPTATVDSMQIFATPIDVKARPGFGYPYFVGYANVGTTKLTPTIKLDYNNVYLNYDSCNNSSVTNSGNSLNLLYPNMPAGFTSSYLAYFKVKPTAPLGDTIKATASVTSATTSVQYETPYSIITGSFDPNDKDATPVLTPTQVALGKPINYTIRFQNTGNDTAFTVVLADTLSGLLQTNSLQLISSSHPCKVTVKKGIAYFEFKNILLPYKNINEIKSHGFVRFTVKPKTSLTAGTSIYNKAYIYFDYNAPIITNTAVTLIKAPVIVPVKMMSYELRMVNEKQVANLWVTATEINTSHFNIQRSVDGNDFKTIGIVAAKGTGDYSFIDDIRNLELGIRNLYYRLEIVDKDGSKQYSGIRNVELGMKSNGISVFPNPAKDFVTIASKENIKSISIMNQLGQIITYQTINNNSCKLSIQSLSKGLYTISVVNSKEEIKNEKLIVQ